MTSGPKRSDNHNLRVMKVVTVDGRNFQYETFVKDC